ncbi:hypothetical protein MFLAVUS_002875 [Mucor flavus]|uniref:Uncharacterized protein n=1 Tax=Mucor flavus TaxID=439312 RepID=A0ABP9YRL6_9FUNG
MTFSDSGVKYFEGKVAVVTGGSRGIGKAVIDELIEKGARVVIGDILESLGNEVANAYNEKAGTKVAAFIRTDVSKYSDNKALFQFAETEFGGVDIAILSADDLEEGIFNVNTIGVIKGSKVALMHMAKRGGGSIVCIASTAGLYTVFDTSAYNASKHAVVGYVRSCSIMPAVCNVRVNAVCPSWVATDLLVGFTSSSTVDPLVEAMNAFPFVAMSDVVKGVFTFLYEESRNAEALMILSDGLQWNVPAPLPACFFSEECVNVQKRYFENAIPYSKKQLAEALERYNAEQQSFLDLS